LPEPLQHKIAKTMIDMPVEVHGTEHPVNLLSKTLDKPNTTQTHCQATDAFDARTVTGAAATAAAPEMPLTTNKDSEFECSPIVPATRPTTVL
jgi:hypothetical protein